MSISSSATLLLTAALSAAGLATNAWPQSRPLTVVSWGGAYQDAQREVYFKPFTAKTGIRLVDESWDGGIGVLRAKLQGGANNWDLVQVESEELQLGCEEGIFERLDWGKIGGRDAYMPEATNDCGVGAILYSFVLAYDSDKFKGGEPQSWADFFDLRKFPGKRSLRKGAKTNLELALIADGVKPTDVYQLLSTQDGVDRAFRKLETIKTSIVWWEKGSQSPQLLASGEVVMASAYNGRIAAANKTDKRNFRITWKNSLYTIDSWAIMKGSPNKVQAQEYLAFAGSPTVQKGLPLLIPYGVTNKRSTELVAKAVLPDLPTHPEYMASALLISDKFWLENLDRLTQRFNTWVSK